jgi:hypothetical protein
MGAQRGYLECREPDGRKVMYRTETVLASPDLQKQCTQKRALKRILADMKVSPKKIGGDATQQAGKSTLGVISRVALFALPSLAVIGIRAMMFGKREKHD